MQRHMKKRYSQNHCCSLFLIPHKLIQLDLIQIEMWPSTPSNIHAQSRWSVVEAFGPSPPSNGSVWSLWPHHRLLVNYTHLDFTSSCDNAHLFFKSFHHYRPIGTKFDIFIFKSWGKLNFHCHSLRRHWLKTRQVCRHCCPSVLIAFDAFDRRQVIESERNLIVMASRSAVQLRRDNFQRSSTFFPRTSRHNTVKIRADVVWGQFCHLPASPLL